MVVVDTSIWIDFLAGRDNTTTAALRRLIDDESAAYTGVVLTELLRGMRTEHERRDLELELSGATFIEMHRSVWKRAGAISGDLDSGGAAISMADTLIAALVLEYDLELFTRDTDFERIPGLRLYKPEGDADA